MIEVQDVPRSDMSDDEELESEEESDEQDDEEAEADADDGADATLQEPEDAAARLEKLRIHRALGNDGAPEDEPPAPVPLYSEEEESDSDSDADSDDSVGPAPSDYTQYVRAPRAPRQRINVTSVSKLGKVDELRETVAGEIARAARGQAPRTKGAAKVGKAKGHKWKANASYQIGKDTGW